MSYIAIHMHVLYCYACAGLILIAICMFYLIAICMSYINSHMVGRILLSICMSNITSQTVRKDSDNPNY